MSKGYYIYSENCGGSGVLKKIDMQIETFAYCSEISKIELHLIKQSLLMRLVGLLPFCSAKRDYDVAIDRLDEPTFIYIRAVPADREYILFLRKIRKKYPSCKLLVEIPTYPYDKEFLKSIYSTLLLIRDIIYRRLYKKYIDRFVTFSDDKYIYGVKTIRTINGINVASYCSVCAEREYNPNSVHIVAVALFSPHHGYERVIEGMAKYYSDKSNTREVFFHLVGEGGEKKIYNKLANKYGLEGHIIFHGPLYGKELDDIYDLADIGLSHFGAYKDNISQITAIKTREYLAKGIPVALGVDDNMFLNNPTDFCLKYENNNSPVNIGKLLSYLDNLHKDRSKTKLVNDIRSYSFDNADNRVTMKPILDYIDV